MAIIKGVSKILKSDLPGAPDWFDPIISTLNGFLDTVIGALRGRLTFYDNFYTEYKELDFVHGVELRVSTKMPTYSGIIIIKPPNKDDSSLSIVGWHARQTTSKEVGVTISFSGGLGKTGSVGILILG
jgi:hypothetical protein